MSGLGNIVSRRSLSTFCVIAGWGLWISALFFPAVLFTHMNMPEPAVEYGGICFFYCMFPLLWLVIPSLLLYAAANVIFFIAPFFLRTTSETRQQFIRFGLVGAVVFCCGAE